MLIYITNVYTLGDTFKVLKAHHYSLLQRIKKQKREINIMPSLFRLFPKGEKKHKPSLKTLFETVHFLRNYVQKRQNVKTIWCF